jgi:hypothetical protein
MVSAGAAGVNWWKTAIAEVRGQIAEVKKLMTIAMRPAPRDFYLCNPTPAL